MAKFVDPDAPVQARSWKRNLFWVLLGVAGVLGVYLWNPLGWWGNAPAPELAAQDGQELAPPPEAPQEVAVPSTSEIEPIPEEEEPEAAAAPAPVAEAPKPAPVATVAAPVAVQHTVPAPKGQAPVLEGDVVVGPADATTGEQSCDPANAKWVEGRAMPPRSKCVKVEIGKNYRSDCTAPDGTKWSLVPESLECETKGAGRRQIALVPSGQSAQAAAAPPASEAPGVGDDE